MLRRVAGHGEGLSSYGSAWHVSPGQCLPACTPPLRCPFGVATRACAHAQPPTDHQHRSRSSVPPPPRRRRLAGRGKNKQGGLLGGTSSVMSAREMARNAVARSHDEIEEELAIAKVKRNSFIEHPSSDMFRTLAKLHTSAHTMKTPFGDEADDDDPSFSGYSGNATTKGAASTRGKDKDKDRRLSLEEKLAQMESNFSP